MLMGRELPCRGGAGDIAQLCGWPSGHERPGHTRWVRDELLGAGLHAKDAGGLAPAGTSRKGQ
jgi:hypothetical protein